MYSRLLTRSSLRSPGGRGFRGVRCSWLVGCIMVELRRCVAFLGMVVDGRRASWCRQPKGRRLPLGPCMPGWFGVGRLACGLFIVGSFSLQPFGWYMVVLAVLWSACSSWGPSRCGLRQRSRMLSFLSFELVLRFAVTGLSNVPVIVARPGCVRRVVLVCRRRSRQWSACPGLCGGPYGLGWPRLIAVGRPLRRLFPVGCVLPRLLCCGVSAREVVALLPALRLARVSG